LSCNKRKQAQSEPTPYTRTAPEVERASEVPGVRSAVSINSYIEEVMDKRNIDPAKIREYKELIRAGKAPEANRL
jgi:hypothetical protein